MSKSHADRIIQLLETFGPSYFMVAQLTRIAPEAYRAIATAVKDNQLHLENEAIALLPENATKVAAAVAELRRRGAADAPGASSQRRLETLERQCHKLADQFGELSVMLTDPADRRELLACLAGLRSSVVRLEAEIR